MAQTLLSQYPNSYDPGSPASEIKKLEWAIEQLYAGAQSGNVAVPGNLDVKGTTTLEGTLTTSGLPTADPHVAGQVWKNSGVLTVSAG